MGPGVRAVERRGLPEARLSVGWSRETTNRGYEPGANPLHRTSRCAALHGLVVSVAGGDGEDEKLIDI